MKEFNAKKKTALLAVNILLSILLVISMCVTVALAVTQFSLNMGGNISFQAKDVQATISQGIVANGTVAGENKMQAITLTPDNDGSAEISSWNGLEISFAGKKDVTITFNVTNNHTEEALLFTANVNEGTKNNNMTMSMTIDGKKETEVVIPANSGSNDNEVECVVTFHITDPTKSANIQGFAIDCGLEIYETYTVTINWEGEMSAPGSGRDLNISINDGIFFEPEKFPYVANNVTKISFTGYRGMLRAPSDPDGRYKIISSSGESFTVDNLSGEIYSIEVKSDILITVERKSAGHSGSGGEL